MKVALTIAGSDSGGGAGIQADLKTFHQFGVFGTSAISAVTAQNTIGVSAVHPVPPETLRAQLEAVFSDLRPHAAKTGMLATRDHIEVVVHCLKEYQFDSLVVDPVMVATSGDRLLDVNARSAMVDDLLSRALVVTPNIPEAEELTGMGIKSVDEMMTAAHQLMAMGARAALVTGGHMQGDTVHDVWVDSKGEEIFSRTRTPTTNTHGTGCTLSAAITAGLACGLVLRDAVRTAGDYVHRAIATAPTLGRGHGPINHFADPGHR